MIGFEITINNNLPIAIASDISQLFLIANQQNILLIPSGIDKRKDRLKWADQILQKGDRISIKVKEIDVITPPVIIEKRDLDYIKQKYLKLKTNLEIKGLM